ncbi:hypothetical protein MGG_09248 [Pyricularia oryzae 70-15]|uniref:Chitin-binding type-1 domain-containing protein n=2 Tax=Pyricularia oryzae TaxID=318829 RepID=G4MQ70_PYRO7|nr:uncharacterized protein MGG_09248 [Pyricularia oryzae 70-15]EHA57263.1 hypothetical protein MGG_09248 [Pyricularia oryzae 70-15]ELQ41335.1 hypothetical protein OOU_Y34scaffold00283g29 [Pyricularia oryzae Y34]KAI7923123.1 hypothetical protein M0657_005301 [Pyricularia oryzae]KAI7926062.1 hypothetical protein M9X92_003018 [Pyricularia oryzae]
MNPVRAARASEPRDTNRQWGIVIRLPACAEKGPWAFEICIAVGVGRSIIDIGSRPPSQPKMFRTIVLLTLTGLAAAAISVDGSCGGANNATCQGSEFGDCCSMYGYCGKTTPYCGQGCNTKFGTCGGPGATNGTALPSAEAPAKSTADARRSNRPVVVRRSL